jgi:hypothetical protein
MWAQSRLVGREVLQMRASVREPSRSETLPGQSDGRFTCQAAVTRNFDAVPDRECCRAHAQKKKDNGEHRKRKVEKTPEGGGSGSGERWVQQPGERQTRRLRQFAYGPAVERGRRRRSSSQQAGAHDGTCSFRRLGWWRRRAGGSVWETCVLDVRVCACVPGLSGPIPSEFFLSKRPKNKIQPMLFSSFLSFGVVNQPTSQSTLS